MTAPARILTREEAWLPLPESRRVKFEALRAGLCKWPIGELQHHDFCFCGADTGDTARPYCATHQLRAVQPRPALPARKDRAA